jgi:hypothetical protein
VTIALEPVPAAGSRRESDRIALVTFAAVEAVAFLVIVRSRRFSGSFSTNGIPRSTQSSERRPPRAGPSRLGHDVAIAGGLVPLALTAAIANLYLIARLSSENATVLVVAGTLRDAYLTNPTYGVMT